MTKNDENMSRNGNKNGAHEWYEHAPMDEMLREACRKYALTKDCMWEMSNRAKGKDGSFRDVKKWVLVKAGSEKIAAAENISFDEPKIIEASIKDNYAVVMVTGRKIDEDGKEKVISTLGSFIAYKNTSNGKPQYDRERFPYEMAEKRAKSRVVLMMISIYGLVYGEDEIDDNNQDRPPPAPKKPIKPDAFEELIREHNNDVEMLSHLMVSVDDINYLRDLYGRIEETNARTAISKRAMELKETNVHDEVCDV